MNGHELLDDGFQIELPSGWLLKTRPAVEGDRRFVYCEPSTDAVDTQGEDIDQTGLAKASPEYLRFGNVDLNHMTLLGPKPVAQGGYGLSFDEARKFEIGVPREVVAGGTRFFLDEHSHVQNESNAALAHAPVMLKCELYRGVSERVAKANETWASMTEQDPPQRYYPSIGGYPVRKQGSTIKALMWKNVAFADVPFFLPVNRAVKAVTAVPYAAFAKAIMAGGGGYEALMKGLEAGGGADTSLLTGGAALRRESIEPHVMATIPGGDYHAAVSKYIGELGSDGCAHLTGTQSLPKIIEHFVKCDGMDERTAIMTAHRMLREVSAQIAQESSKNWSGRRAA